jgi:hypothetical protein
MWLKIMNKACKENRWHEICFSFVKRLMLAKLVNVMKFARACLMGVAAFLAAFQAHATIIGGGVTFGGGNWIFINDPSGLSVGADDFDDLHLRGFNEDQNIAVGSAVSAFSSWNWNNATTSGTTAVNIANGTEVASHYIVFDPLNSATIEAYVEFDAAVLAIIVGTSTLNQTDTLINNSVTYKNPNLRGLENWQDWVRIDPLDSNRIRLHFSASTPGDYIRVLTQHSPLAAPEPAISILLVLGLAFTGFASRRR